MTGIVDFFVSINKIALFAFVVVFGFLIFEVKKMQDEKKKDEKLTVPSFVDTVKPSPIAAQNSTPLPPTQLKPVHARLTCAVF